MRRQPAVLVAVVALVVVGGLVAAGCGESPEAATTPLSAVDLSPATVVAEPETDVPDTVVPTEAEPTEMPSTDTPVPEPTTEPATAVPATAVPEKFVNLNPGEDRDCDEFASQAEAQAYWDYHRSDQWPNPGRLDGNGNGIVCEAGGGDNRAPAQPTSPPAPSRPCDLSLNCTDFGSWAEMFAWWEACGRPEQYDRNGDGIPCESLR